jgi:hypothetical protein
MSCDLSRFYRKTFLQAKKKRLHSSRYRSPNILRARDNDKTKPHYKKYNGLCLTADTYKNLRKTLHNQFTLDIRA